MTAQTNTKRSLAQRWANYQPTKSTLGWACVGAAGATMIIGFTWGGWVTGGTSRGVAANAEIAARGELASAICVERFNAQPGAAERLVELNAISGASARRQFVEAGGWATMPGQSSPDRRGAEGCVTALTAA